MNPKPECLIEWEKTTMNPPQVCYNCDFYTIAGFCEKHQAEPPADFAATPGACDSWVQLIPF